MEKIISKYAYINTNNNDISCDIRLMENKPRLTLYNPQLYENITLRFFNNILIFEGTRLLSHESYDEDIWISDLRQDLLPLSEYENIIKLGYRSRSDKYKDIKSKFIPKSTIYLYKKESIKFMVSNFIIHFEVDEKEGSTFKKFIETHETI